MGKWKNAKKSTKTWNHKVLLMEEILPSIGLSWPITKPPFGSWAVYFHHSVRCVSVDKNSLNWGNICKPKTPRLLVQISSKRKHKNSVHHPALEDKSVRHFVHIRRKNICLAVSWATQSTIQSPIRTNHNKFGCLRPNFFRDDLQLLGINAGQLVEECWRDSCGYLTETHLSHEKNHSYFPLYWLVNRDPYNGLL